MNRKSASKAVHLTATSRPFCTGQVEMIGKRLGSWRGLENRVESFASGGDASVWTSLCDFEAQLRLKFNSVTKSCSSVLPFKPSIYRIIKKIHW